MFQAGASDDGKKLAAKHADAIFTTMENSRRSTSVHRDVKQQLKTTVVVPLIASSECERDCWKRCRRCGSQYQTTAALVSVKDALNYLGRYFEHHDFQSVSLDEAVPGP